MTPTNRSRRAAARGALTLLLPAVLGGGNATAQTAPPPQTPAAAAPAASAPAASAPAIAPPAAPGQKIEITGRQTDTDQRRQSTAAKTIIGREEIDKFGDATVGEVLRRLPGVTTPGAPGRGGPPRLRGLGGGFTQLLIDGQRLPPGFSLESLTPDQVERIEILRAPTAETGARAIAGTINIVTREGYRRRLNDLRIGMSTENGRLTNGLFWTHNDSAGPLTYNLSSGLFRRRGLDENTGQTTEVDLDRGELVGLERSTSQTRDQRTGLNLTARLQWRLEGGDSLSLNPSIFTSEADSARRETLVQLLPVPTPAAPARYDLADTETVSAFTAARTALQWRKRLSTATRLDVDAGAGLTRSRSQTARQEFRSAAATPLRINDDTSRARERSLNLTAKLTSLLGGKADEPGTEHNLVSGVEVESVKRNETRRALQDGAPLLPGFSNDLAASTLRTAAYVQNEVALNPSWSVYGGLRWEGIHTRGDDANPAANPAANPTANAAIDTRPSNRSNVWTPLAQVLWKPDPKKRDQVRLALTRSYRNPSVQQLIARPGINSRFPAAGENRLTNPDSSGNPNLKPELATGLDLAFERYLEGGGVLSANVFHRRIGGLVRNLIALETVSYSPVPRWVSRPRNLGDATTQGIELEAKYRLDQVWAGAPRVELRHNLALFRSHVDGVRGPDNRLDQQAKATANIGADYRLRGTPLSLGGNINWVPGYRTQLGDNNATTVSTKRVADVFALWTFNPQVALRVLASNLAPQDYETSNEFDLVRGGRNIRETSSNLGPSALNFGLRLELKL